MESPVECRITKHGLLHAGRPLIKGETITLSGRDYTALRRLNAAVLPHEPDSPPVVHRGAPPVPPGVRTVKVRVHGLGPRSSINVEGGVAQDGDVIDASPDFAAELVNHRRVASYADTDDADALLAALRAAVGPGAGKQQKATLVSKLKALVAAQ